MKTHLTILALSFFCLIGFSQNTRDALVGNYTPPFYKEQLFKAKLISDIIPDCPTHWNTLINYVAIQIMVSSDGHILLEESISDTLTLNQKRLLNSADMCSEISIKIKFRYKDTTYAIGSNEKIKTMNFKAAVVPAIEAEFPGGYAQAIVYVKENVIKKIQAIDTSKYTPRMTAAFVVDEEGNVNNAKIIKSSNNPELDRLLLEQINKMPKWTPATNIKGERVKQEFKIASLLYGRGGC